MWEEIIQIKTYYIKKNLVVKKRIDNKVIIIEYSNKPIILSSIGGKLIQAFSGGNSLKNILEDNHITDLKRIDILTKTMLYLVKKGYIVEEENMYKLDLVSKWTLEEVFLELSKKCNLRCKHCYISSDIIHNELCLYEWKTLVDNCKKMGVYLIKLTGGEAMLMPYFFELVEYIKSLDISVRLYTNGSFLTADTIKTLKEKQVDEIQISLDGASAQVHDAFRRTKGNYEKIMQALPILEKMEIATILSFTMSSYNQHELEEFIAIARKYKSLKVVASPYINYHQTFKHNDSLLDVTDLMVDELKKCFWQNNDIWSDKTRYYYTFPNKYIGYCGFGIYSAYIDSQGKVLLCPLINEESYIVGNVREQCLEEIWETSSILQEYRKYTIANIEGCNKCEHVNACRGGCRARAYFINKDILTKDPISCKMFK